MTYSKTGRLTVKENLIFLGLNLSYKLNESKMLRLQNHLAQIVNMNLLFVMKLLPHKFLTQTKMLKTPAELLEHPDNAVRNCIYDSIGGKAIYPQLAKMEREMQILVFTLLQAQREQIGKEMKKFHGCDFHEVCNLEQVILNPRKNA